MGGIIVDVFYTCSILNLLRLIYLCAYTEPGIIPAVQSEHSHAIRNQCANSDGIHVEYKSEQERAYDGQDLDYFFNENRFKYGLIVDPNKESYTLSLCSTCMIARPPRAFHCSTCGVCVEAQDHHCPWMGTCIGKRNLKYFLGFLIMTALHAFLTAAICTSYFVRVTNKIDEFDFDRSNERMLGLMSVGVGFYAAVLGITLSAFSVYSLCLMSSNITSNENLRTRWHAKHIKVLDRKRQRLNRKANE